MQRCCLLQGNEAAIPRPMQALDVGEEGTVLLFIIKTSCAECKRMG